MVLQMPAGRFYMIASSPHVPALETVLTISEPSSAASITPLPATTRCGGWTKGQTPVGLYRDDTLKPHAWIDDAEGFAGLLKTQGLIGSSVVDRLYFARRGWDPGHPP